MGMIFYNMLSKQRASQFTEISYINKKKELLNWKKWQRIQNRKFAFLMDNKHINGCLRLLRFFQSKPKDKHFYQPDCQRFLVKFD